MLTYKAVKDGIKMLLYLFRIFDFILLDDVTELIENSLGSIKSNVGGDEELFKFLEQLLVNLCESLEEIINLANNGILGLKKTLFQFVKEPHQATPSVFLQFRLR